MVRVPPPLAFKAAYALLKALMMVAGDAPGTPLKLSSDTLYEGIGRNGVALPVDVVARNRAALSVCAALLLTLPSPLPPPQADSKPVALAASAPSSNLRRCLSISLMMISLMGAPC